MIEEKNNQDSSQEIVKEEPTNDIELTALNIFSEDKIEIK